MGETIWIPGRRCRIALTAPSVTGREVMSPMVDEYLRAFRSWVQGLSIVGMAIWTMIPDEIEEEETRVATLLGAGSKLGL